MPLRLCDQMEMSSLGGAVSLVDRPGPCKNTYAM